MNSLLNAIITLILIIMIVILLIVVHKILYRNKEKEIESFIEKNNEINPWKRFFKALSQENGSIFGEIVGKSGDITLNYKSDKELNLIFSNNIEKFSKKLNLHLVEISADNTEFLKLGFGKASAVYIRYFIGEYEGVKLNIISYDLNLGMSDYDYKKLIGCGFTKIQIYGEKISVYLYPWFFGNEPLEQQILRPKYNIERLENELKKLLEYKIKQ